MKQREGMIKTGVIVVTPFLFVTSFLLLWEAFMLPQTTFSRHLFVGENSEVDPIFVPLPVKDGMVWFGQHAVKDAVVLGAWETICQRRVQKRSW